MLLGNSRVLPQHLLQMLSGASAPPGIHCGGIVAGRRAVRAMQMKMMTGGRRSCEERRFFLLDPWLGPSTSGAQDWWKNDVNSLQTILL